MTQNKIDISIFEFKDRPIFRKNNQNHFENAGKIEIKSTKPGKKDIQ